jgi:hypothetical protein
MKGVGRVNQYPKKADLYLLNSVLFNALLVYKTLHLNQHANHKKYVDDFHRVWNTEKHTVTEFRLHDAQPLAKEPTTLRSHRGSSRKTTRRLTNICWKKQLQRSIKENPARKSKGKGTPRRLATATTPFSNMCSNSG